MPLAPPLGCALTALRAPDDYPHIHTYGCILLRALFGGSKAAVGGTGSSGGFQPARDPAREREDRRQAVTRLRALLRGEG